MRHGPPHPAVRALLGAFLLVPLIVLFAGCASLRLGPPQPGSQGTLLLAGENLRPANAPVHRRFVELAGHEASIAVVALGMEQAASDVREDLRRYGARGNVFVVTLRADGMEDVRDASGVFLVGPVEADALPGALTDALRNVLGRGGAVAASGATAAMLADSFARSGESGAALLREPSCEGNANAICAATGAGLFPFGVLDETAHGGEGLGRLVALMREEGARHGFAIGENRAIEVDLATGETTFFGPQALLLIEARRAEFDAEGVRGLRIALLGEGDRLDARRGRVAFAADRPRLGPDPVAPLLPTQRSAWAPHALADWGEWLGRAGVEERSLEAPPLRLQLIRDGEAVLYGPGAASPGTAFAGLRADLVR